MNKTCKFCAKQKGSIGNCGQSGLSRSSFSFICTRERGHSGDHVACGYLSHQCLSWPNKADIDITEEL